VNDSAPRTGETWMESGAGGGVTTPGEVDRGVDVNESGWSEFPSSLSETGSFDLALKASSSSTKISGTVNCGMVCMRPARWRS